MAVSQQSWGEITRPALNTAALAQGNSSGNPAGGRPRTFDAVEAARAAVAAGAAVFGGRLAALLAALALLCLRRRLQPRLLLAGGHGCRGSGLLLRLARKPGCLEAGTNAQEGPGGQQER